MPATRPFNPSTSSQVAMQRINVILEKAGVPKLEIARVSSCSISSQHAIANAHQQTPDAWQTDESKDHDEEPTLIMESTMSTISELLRLLSQSSQTQSELEAHIRRFASTERTLNDKISSVENKLALARRAMDGMRLEKENALREKEDALKRVKEVEGEVRRLKASLSSMSSRGLTPPGSPSMKSPRTVKVDKSTPQTSPRGTVRSQKSTTTSTHSKEISGTSEPTSKSKPLASTSKILKSSNSPEAAHVQNLQQLSLKSQSSNNTDKILLESNLDDSFTTLIIDNEELIETGSHTGDLDERLKAIQEERQKLIEVALAIGRDRSALKEERDQLSRIVSEIETNRVVHELNELLGE